MIRFLFPVLAAVLALSSCESTNAVGKKKKERPLLPGEEESSLSWNRPTRAGEVNSPFGLPTSR